MLPALAFLANPAFWGGVGKATSAGSFLSGLFGKKKTTGGETVDPMSLLNPYQQQAGGELSNFIQSYLKNYVPGQKYGGKFTAPLTDIESGGLERLQGLMGATGTGELFDAASQNVLDTLGGKFADPNTSPFIKSMTNLSKMN